MNQSISNLFAAIVPKEKCGKFYFFSVVAFGLMLITTYYVFVGQFPITSKIRFYPIDINLLQNQTLMVGFDQNFSSFVISEITPQQLWDANKNVSYQGYFDLKFSKDCGIPNSHNIMFELMKFWMEFAAKYNIPWWLTCGSLIGALRHKDMVAWDHDIDLGIPAQYESIIRNFSTPRKQISSTKPNIIVRPGPHCPYNGQRMNCQGKLVSIQIDGCAFCGPLARIFYHQSKRIDIFLYYITIHEKKLKMIDEATFEYLDEPPRNPIDWFYPLRNCSFMGFTAQCPRQSEAYLTRIYTNFASQYKCVRGYWVKI